MSAPSWLGLLKWSLANSDGTRPTDANEMSREDKEWLQTAMKELVKDEPQRMSEIMLELNKVLNEGCVVEEDTIENWLEELRDIASQIDMAQVFVKFGGMRCLMALLECESLPFEIRALGASVVGAITQNNAKTQSEMHDAHFIDKLVALYLQSMSPVFCAKLIHAVSCTIRNHPLAEQHFCQEYLEPVFTHAQTLNKPEVLKRIVFLSNALFASDSATATRRVHMTDTLLPAVSAHLLSEDVDLRDTTLRLLTTVAEYAAAAAGAGAETAVSGPQVAEDKAMREAVQLTLILMKPQLLQLTHTRQHAVTATAAVSSDSSACGDDGQEQLDYEYKMTCDLLAVIDTLPLAVCDSDNDSGSDSGKGDVTLDELKKRHEEGHARRRTERATTFSTAHDPNFNIDNDNIAAPTTASASTTASSAPLLLCDESQQAAAARRVNLTVLDN